jgi:hypothetical protein
MSLIRKNLLVAIGVLALVVPAAAVANHGESHGKGKDQGKGHAKTHGVAWVFKGLYAGESKVEVKAGNSRVRRGGFIGETVEFDLSDARIVVADTDGDSDRDLDDVQVGDRVLVRAKLPRKEPGDQPFDAKRLVDQTQHPAG